MSLVTAVELEMGGSSVAKDSPRGQQISVAFRPDDLEDLREVAEETDTPIATLIRQWTLERLRQIKPRRREGGEEVQR